MREYLLRGGFFMCDDFHGDVEWECLRRQHEEGVPRPADRGDRPKETPFSTPLRPGPALPGARRAVLETGLTYEKGESGKTPHWRGIYDDRGRIMVAMCHNMDLGDSWEHADNPEYPARFSDLGIRIGVNYHCLFDDALKGAAE